MDECLTGRTLSAEGNGREGSRATGTSGNITLVLSTRRERIGCGAETEVVMHLGWD